MQEKKGGTGYFLGNVPQGSMKSKIKKYAKKLIEMDSNIEEVFLIGSLVNGGFNEKSDIDIVCVFNEEFTEKCVSFVDYVVLCSLPIQNLKRKMSDFERSLKLNHEIDLSYFAGNAKGGLASSGKFKLLIKRGDQ